MAAGRNQSAQSVTRPLMMMCMVVAGMTLYFQMRLPKPPVIAKPITTPVSVRPVEPAWGDRADDTQLVVDLSDRAVYLYRDEKLKMSYRVAVGQPGWETPVGEFRVRQMVQNPTWKHPITDEVYPPGGANPLGARWIGFAADEHMKLGFHGSGDSSVGQAVSHGCLRMKNTEVQSLFSEVSLGTLVTVRP